MLFLQGVVVITRHLIVGNDSLYVALDKNANIRDLYFPHVGEENHVSGHHCRIGVWVDGKFSWVGDDWNKTLKYKKESMVTHVTLTHQQLGIELTLNDTVHHSRDIFLRRIHIKNLRDHPRSVRVFFSQDLLLLETHTADTAMYHPGTGSVIHYKRNRYFLINGQNNNNQGLYQYSTGIADFGDAEGTWRDAEDGELSNNPIAQGSVDSTVSIKAEVGTDATMYYWIAAGCNLKEVTDLNQCVLDETPELLIARAENYHRAWVNNAGVNFTDLPENLIGLFKHSLLVLRSQMNNNGAIIAANDSDIMQFNRDHYSYMWPRDGALVAHGLSLAGHSESSARFFNFCKNLLDKGGYLHHKYNPDGTLASSWHPLVQKDHLLPIQEDETALVIYALWEHYNQHRDIEFVEKIYESFIKMAADFLTDYRHPVYKLPLESYDLWEEQQGIFTFTTATVYAGLIAAANFASIFSDTLAEKKYNNTAREIKQAACEHLYDEEAKRFVKKITIENNTITKDLTVDSSTYAVFAFGMLPPGDERVVNTMNAIKNRLWVNTKIGGIARYENDYYQRSDYSQTGNPWVICTLWLAQWHIAKAETASELEPALELLQWVADHTLESGMMPEQLDPRTGKPLSVSPLTWSHSSFVVTVARYLEKLNRHTACNYCGAPQHRPEQQRLW